MKIKWKLSIYIGIVLFLVMSSSFIYIYKMQENQAHENYYKQAKSISRDMGLVREVIHQHGGLYVEKGDGITSDPYLATLLNSSVDIQDNKGNNYTQMVSFTFIRQMADILSSDGSIKDVDKFIYRIPSKNALNPINRADGFETRILDQFSRGEIKEYSAIEKDSDGQRSYRYMEPFIAMKMCFKCHDYQEKIGEVVGAVSIAIPIEEAETSHHQSLKNILFFFIISTGFIMGLVYAVSERLSEPIMKLSTASERIRKGEHGVRVEINDKTDEINNLAMAFNQMTSELQDKISQLTKSEEKFRSIFQGVREGIYVSTPEGKFLDVNPAMLEIFGYPSKDDMLDTHIPEDFFLDPGKRERIITELKEKGSVKDIDIVLKKKDGSNINCSLTVTGVKDGEGNLIRLEGLIRDITKLKEAEKLQRDYSLELEKEVEKKTSHIEGQKQELSAINQELISTNEELDQAKKKLEEYNQDLEVKVKEKTLELQQALTELQELDSLKDDIISNVSHELKTPITIMQGSLELAFEEEDPRDKKELFDMFINALKGQEKIVDDLLAVSKIGYFEPCKEPQNLREIIENTVNGKSRLRKTMGITMETHVEDDVPMIPVDCTMINKVFENLLENAIKFNKEDGTIGIHARKIDGSVEVSISDTGIGIEKEKMENIFKPLTQLDPSTRRKYGGTGTGLAVAMRIVEAHGGKIWARSKYGEGSTFYFTIPI